ncbi:MAG: MBOAT family O-acyltransferase [Flavobacteriales bacterium]
MLFNSIEFLIFLPTILILYFAIPSKYRWVLLLLGSYAFYMFWKVEYLALIVFSTVLDFFLGRKMGDLSTKKERKPYLIISLVLNLGVLFTFKYYNFFADSSSVILDWMNVNKTIPLSDLLLPVGISFYTFQTLSYSIDVYNNKIKPETHLGHFALFVSFFPQLVAGPIERFSSLSPQLKANHKFNLEHIKNGFRLILYGLFIKMVIADNLSVYVDDVYADSKLFSSGSIVTSMFFYSFQIYADFYGYSLIAIGTAKCLGISLMDNFRTPYLSKTISEFWQRWHISLSTWFKDYLYFPMGGSRVKKTKWMFNIFIVFLASGIWHGANWTFIFWGLLYALLYISETKLALPHAIKTNKFVQIILILKTFIFVSIFWVFFRSQSIFEAFDFFKYMVLNTGDTFKTLDINIFIWGLLLFFIGVDHFLSRERFDVFIQNKPFVFRWLIYTVFISGILIFSGVEDYQFIYFQF